jgi:hypothetical protein
MNWNKTWQLSAEMYLFIYKNPTHLVHRSWSHKQRHDEAQFISSEFPCTSDDLTSNKHCFKLLFFVNKKHLLVSEFARDRFYFKRELPFEYLMKKVKAYYDQKFLYFFLLFFDTQQCCCQIWWLKARDKMKNGKKRKTDKILKFHLAIRNNEKKSCCCRCWKC